MGREVYRDDRMEIPTAPPTEVLWNQSISSTLVLGAGSNLGLARTPAVPDRSKEKQLLAIGS